MRPSHLAAQLRRIAAKIDASSKPDRRLVARDLKRLVAAVTGKYIVMKGPWGWMGYELDVIDIELVRLVGEAHDVLFIQPSIRGSIKFYSGWDPDKLMDELDIAPEDGQFTPVDNATMKKALQDAIDGDEEAMILHG